MTNSIAESAVLRETSRAGEHRANDDVRQGLRRALLLDAIASGVSGLALVIGAEPLGDLFDLSPTLLRWVGIGMAPWVIVLTYLANRAVQSRSATWGVIGFNTSWIVASLILLVSGWVNPSALGYGFVILQALVVAFFVELQCKQVRRL